MNFWEKHRITIIALFIIVLLIGSVFGWNYIVKKQKEQKEQKVVDVDTSDVNNVNLVDAKLDGNDYKITQPYLYNYTKYKSSTWYMSNGIITKISTLGDDAIIELKSSKDNKKSLIATISKDKIDVSVGDEVNFVGTINIRNSEISLAAISKDKISYSKYVTVDISRLINNLEVLKNTHFIINGYMVTDGEKFKLYESKEVYKNDNETIKFFTINWEEDFNYTGTIEVKLNCVLEDTYVLGNCSIIK